MNGKDRFESDKRNVENSYSNQIEEFFSKIEDLIEKQLEANRDFIKETDEKLSFTLYDLDETFSETSFIYNRLTKIVNNKRYFLNSFLQDNNFDQYYTGSWGHEIDVFGDDAEDYVLLETSYDENLSTFVSEINDVLDRIKKIMDRKNTIEKKKNEICIAITEKRIQEYKKLDDLEKKIKELQEQFDNLSSELRKNYMNKVTSV